VSTLPQANLICVGYALPDLGRRGWLPGGHIGPPLQAECSRLNQPAPESQPVFCRLRGPSAGSLGPRDPKSLYQNRGTGLAAPVGMSKPLVPDELWDAIEPLLPPEPPKPKGGRPRVPDRACLTGIVFVLKTGIPWEWLPQELGCGSGMTCWRRLRDWQAAGVWDRLHRALLDRLGEADQIDWERACLDSASVPAKRGATTRGRTPRTARNRARSAMLWSTGAAPRWPRS
jgi:transposase